jgi:hypothetical protein
MLLNSLPASLVEVELFNLSAMISKATVIDPFHLLSSLLCIVSKLPFLVVAPYLYSPLEPTFLAVVV